MEYIEQETEIHRLQKAVNHLLDQPSGKSDSLFPHSNVYIQTNTQLLGSPAGQLTLALMVNLLARMKSIVLNVVLCIPSGIPLHDNVPLVGNDLRAGLEHLSNSVNGSESNYVVTFNYDGKMSNPTITVHFGKDKPVDCPANIWVGANSWTAYINAPQSQSDWNTRIPFGSHMAATLAVAEIFKHLLIHNFPQQAGELQLKLADNVEFCILTYGNDPGINNHPVIDSAINLDNIAIAGVGAGGSAALYSLCCIPELTGRIALIDPGRHKKSNLTRYLLSSYNDCHNKTSKVEVAHEFLQWCHPNVAVQVENIPYVEVIDRDFRLVVSTVDTPEARWDIQKDWPSVILDAAVVETIYAVLRVYPGTGLCLGCKHPYDSDTTWKRRASRWGKTADEMLRLDADCTPVTQEDIEVLAKVQNQSIERFVDLIGIPFNEVPSITECGDTRFNLKVPNQAAAIPFVTTMAGILIAAEIVKEQYVSTVALNNWFEHNMLWIPKPHRHRFRPRVSKCPFCLKLG